MNAPDGQFPNLQPMTPQIRCAVRLGSVFVAVAALIIGLLVCEAALRLLQPRENIHTTATPGVYGRDSEIGWVHKRDFKGTREWAGRTVLIRTDAEGHRIPDVTMSDVGAEQIAFAGDSYVFGNEVNAEETFVHLVGESTGKSAVNLGVNGYSLSQECLALRRFLTQKTRIDRAFLVIYIGNDIENGAYQSKRSGVDDHGHLRDGYAGWWNDVRSFALRHSRLIFYLQIAWRRLVPTVSADSMIDENQRWIYDADVFTRDRLDQHRRVVAALRDDARLRDVPLTVLLMPERGQVYGSLSDLPNRMLSSIVLELGMPVIDLLPKMRSAAAHRPSLWHDIVEGHLSPEGHRLVAEIIFGQLGQDVQRKIGGGLLSSTAAVDSDGEQALR